MMTTHNVGDGAVWPLGQLDPCNTVNVVASDRAVLYKLDVVSNMWTRIEATGGPPEAIWGHAAVDSS